MNIVTRPLTREMRDRFRDIPTRGSQFKASYSKTLDLLERELGYIVDEDGPDPILQMDIDPSDLRLRGGGVKAGTRVLIPSVALTVETLEHGTLTIMGTAFDDWRDNVRGIALSLEALRLMDRFGTTANDEQYRGFEALPPASGFSTVEEAAWFLLEAAEWGDRESLGDPIAALALPQTLSLVYKVAASKLHPDKPGGSEEAFKKLTAAREMLEANR